MKKLLLFYFINFLSISLYSQFNFEGAIIDEGKEVIPFSVVRLDNEVSSFKDTTYIDGTFKFSNIPKASYTCIVSYLGYHSDTIYNLKIDNNLKNTFQLFPNPEPLEAVIVGGRRFPIEKITTRQDSLKYIIKIWGFVKYFAKNTKNIDTDLVSLLHNKLSVEDFINKYYFVQKKPKKSKKVDLDLCLVNHAWISSFNLLSNDMCNKLWKMSKNSINNLNYEFKYLKLKGNKKEYPKISYCDLENINYDKSIIGIARLWNYLNYYYPHICKLGDWDKVLKESLIFVDDFESYKDYVNAIKHIAEKTKDGHSYFNFIKNNPYNSYPNTIPVNYKSFDEKLLITKVLKNNYSLRVNDTILKINNNKLIKNKDFYVSKELKLETGPIKLYSDSNLITIKRNNKLLNIQLEEKDLIKSKDFYYTNLYRKDTMIFDKYKALYVDINQGTKKEYRYLKKHIADYENFVLDLRGYPNSKKYFTNLFLPRNSSHYALVRPIRNNPGKFKLQNNDKGQEIKSNQKLYVLVNQYTNSSSETRAIMLMKHPNVVFVGSYTSSSFGGHYHKLIMPGNLYFTTSTIGVIGSDKRNFHPNGIPINYLVEDENDLEKEIIKLLDK